VILHPTMTDTIDRDVELPIARASATINQCYFFDVNGVGDGGTGRSTVVDPSGVVLYEAGRGIEMVPIEIDLDRVRRERDRGVRGLGQTLKSFRDRPVEFPVYQRDGATESYLQGLGPVVHPVRDSVSPAATSNVIEPAPHAYAAAPAHDAVAQPPPE